ncbi:hypothetical protein JRQ81_011135 [Phrynocephalus forsythii]|uniref:DNA-directed DNA/RNA polymerase mu n=1 Tax=Phrynocephalus forsythii TaxID=171643 RepID=A0A9Q1AR18_9SAUR|nr:hypothetical protein JRQ81_011135 [Phrynocephalus forsythii]
MFQHPVKKRRPRGQPEAPLPEHPVRFPGVVLCLVEKRMGTSRKAFLSNLARSKGFCVEEPTSERVTHVVSEGISGDEAAEWLQRKQGGCVDAGRRNPALLDINWFSESMRASRPVGIEPRHCLRVTASAEEAQGKWQVAAYACQRRSPLRNDNQALTDALETLAEEADFSGSNARSLAFSRAASVLKALPGTVRRFRDLDPLPCLGEHSRRVIQEVLEDGTSAEVETIRQSERYQTMKLFTKIFGVGVKTASQWYREGLRTLDDLKLHPAQLSKEQQAGLLYYKDLNTPVRRADAEVIGQMVQEVVQKCLAGASVTLTGGRKQLSCLLRQRRLPSISPNRGKQSGHDVDLLLTHPTEGQEVGLLRKVIACLDQQGSLLYHSIRRNTFQFLEGQEVGSHASSMDHFERCFSIFRLGDLPGDAEKPGRAMGVSEGSPQSWKAVRVDLVVAPYSQFPFALLGWTGSKCEIFASLSKLLFISAGTEMKCSPLSILKYYFGTSKHEFEPSLRKALGRSLGGFCFRPTAKYFSCKAVKGSDSELRKPAPSDPIGRGCWVPSSLVSLLTMDRHTERETGGWKPQSLSAPNFGGLLHSTEPTCLYHSGLQARCCCVTHTHTPWSPCFREWN